jgi:RimJ/RimL family protein N-acetyltransferase
MTMRETDRLLLRPPRADDLDPYIEIHEDPEVLRHLIVPKPSPGRAGAWRTLALLSGHWLLRGYGQWTVVEKATSEVIGRVGLWNPEGWPGMEVGWVIRRSRWGNGFATEAAQEAVRFAFTQVGADRLISMIPPDNARSIRVAKKIGETFEREDAVDGRAVHIYALPKTALEGAPTPGCRP